MCLIWYPSENLPVFAIRDQNKWNSDNGIKCLRVFRRITMDKNLNYSEHLDKTLKKVSSRVRPLSRIRQNIGPITAETIYKMMILPAMLYCSCNVFVNLPNCHKQKFEDIQNRAMQIVYGLLMQFIQMAKYK